VPRMETPFFNSTIMILPIRVLKKEKKCYIYMQRTFIILRNRFAFELNIVVVDDSNEFVS